MELCIHRHADQGASESSWSPPGAQSGHQALWPVPAVQEEHLGGKILCGKQWAVVVGYPLRSDIQIFVMIFDRNLYVVRTLFDGECVGEGRQSRQSPIAGLLIFAIVSTCLRKDVSRNIVTGRPT